MPRTLFPASHSNVLRTAKLVVAAGLVASACKTTNSGEAPQTAQLAAAPTTAAAAAPASAPASASSASSASSFDGLFTWHRTVQGRPLTADERRTATDTYIDLLRKTRYFDVIDERVHGWPKSDPRLPWYGLWWIGVQIQRLPDGSTAYKHHKTNGSDNLASDTAIMLENTCYAAALWRTPAAMSALHKLIRGMGALIKGTRSQAMPQNGVILSRALYPTTVVSNDSAVPVKLDYDDVRPGDDNGATQFVHVPDNPIWGDVYIKNKRSKDDMGHVLRALVQVEMTCARTGVLTPEMKTDWDDTLSLYLGWASRVKRDNFVIATIDKQRKVVFPSDTLANIFGSVECPMAFATEMFGTGAAGRDCGEGTSGVVDFFAGFNDQNTGILESAHQAAVMAALKFRQTAPASHLMDGLVRRQEAHFDAVRQGSTSDYPPEKLVAFTLRNAVMGIPLHGGESRWLIQRLDDAHRSFLEPRRDHFYSILTTQLEPKMYPYNPNGEGFQWRDIGALLGTCVSPLRNTTSQGVVDCDQLKANPP